MAWLWSKQKTFYEKAVAHAGIGWGTKTFLCRESSKYPLDVLHTRIQNVLLLYLSGIN
jgi:hypothetical protein